ncbi:MAG: histidine triad (HIT) family protein [Rhodothermales bacterium]|jgi:histidine triad (HIT) family protein
MSIFTKIIAGEIPCHKIAETDDFFAFLDIRPVSRGHALVIPKKEVEYIFDMDDDLLGRLMVWAKPIAKALKAVVPCKRIGIMVAGIEVPHTHIHLIPIDGVGDLAFANAKDGDQAELAALAEAVRAQLHA